MILTKSTWLHLRIPFSIFLLPVFLFAFSVANISDWSNVPLVFFIMHLLLYPASNAYNSYFDKDEGSIGILRNPPTVEKELYIVALVFDVIALILGALVGWTFFILILLYGMASKAYSHPSIRLKRYPYVSWFIAGFFQGFVSFMACLAGLQGAGFEVFLEPAYVIPAALSSMLLWGSYPMTQIYQHEEDSRRGDTTLSIKLGITGTFHFTAIFFTISTAGFFLYFTRFHSLSSAFAFLIALTPVLVYFAWWYMKTRQDPSRADFTNTMRLNWVSSVQLSLFFIYLSVM